MDSQSEKQAEAHNQTDPTVPTGEASVGTNDAGVDTSITFTDADMSDHGPGDLGGGRVGGDLAPSNFTHSHDDEDGVVEDEAFVTDAVDDGADLAVPDNGAADAGGDS